MSPTYTLDAARVIERLVSAGLTGVAHVVSSGMRSWYELACTVVHHAGVDVRAESISSDGYPGAAQGPVFSPLSNQRSASLSQAMGSGHGNTFYRRR